MEKKMSNKNTITPIIFTTLFILSSSVFANKIIGIGQVGDKFVYKINGVLTSLPVGSIVDGCLVRSGSGLQCDESFNGALDNTLAIGTMQERLKNIETLSKENATLSQNNHNMMQKNQQLTQELQNLKKSYIAKINKRNKKINTLSNTLNSRN
jgi:FtsZ-binding cell division protein ZapB